MEEYEVSLVWRLKKKVRARNWNEALQKVKAQKNKARVTYARIRKKGFEFIL